MNNVEKHILKQDAQNQEDWAKYLQKENGAYKARIKTLKAEIGRLSAFSFSRAFCIFYCCLCRSFISLNFS